MSAELYSPFIFHKPQIPKRKYSIFDDIYGRNQILDPCVVDAKLTVAVIVKFFFLFKSFWICVFHELKLSEIEMSLFLSSIARFRANKTSLGLFNRIIYEPVNVTSCNVSE